jgi:hypothetical protein
MAAKSEDRENDQEEETDSEGVPASFQRRLNSNVIYVGCRSVEEANMVRYMATARGNGSHPGVYMLRLVKKDKEKLDKEKRELSEKVDDPNRPPDEKRRDLVEQAQELKLNALTDNRLESLQWLKNYILTTDEKENRFVQNLDPEIKAVREKLRKNHEPEMTKRLMTKYGEAMWDFVCDNGGTVPFKSVQVAVNEEDIANYTRLGFIMGELRKLGDQIMADRQAKRRSKTAEVPANLFAGTDESSKEAEFLASY